MVSDYSLLLARQSVENFGEQEAWIAEHQQAMESFVCQDFLALGIEAYRWLKQADETLRAAAQKGIDVAEECVPALASMYRHWLRTCEHAEQQVKRQQERGFSLDNLEAFQEAGEFVRKKVRLIEMHDTLEDAFQGGVFTDVFWSEARKARSS